MAIRLKPKTYGPLVARLNGGRVTVQSAPTQVLAISSPPGDDAASPVEILLTAVGSCLAISIAMAADQMKLDVGQVEVSTSGTRALDLPHRVGQIEAAVTLERVPDGDTAKQLLKRGKELCTVSNSLNVPVELSLA